jgi:hypothetical protein
MTTDEQQITRELGSIKGAAISILVALAKTAGPATPQELAQMSGYNVKTVREKLPYLARAGYVAPCQVRADTWGGEDEGWALKRLPLCLSGLADSPAQTTAGADEARGETGAGEETSPALRTTTVSHVKSVKDRSVGTGRTARRDNGVPPELVAAFKSAGIKRHKWKELASLDHVTPEYVLAHLERVMNHDNPKKRNTGFLIHCIKSGDPVLEVCRGCGKVLPDHRSNCYLRYD